MHAKQLLVSLIVCAAVIACLAVVILEGNRGSSSASPAELEYDWRGHEAWWHTKQKMDKNDKAWFKNTWDTFNKHLSQRVHSEDNLVKQYDSFHTASYDPNVKVRAADPFEAESYESEPLDAEDSPVVPVKNTNIKY